MRGCCEEVYLIFLVLSNNCTLMANLLSFLPHSVCSGGKIINYRYESSSSNHFNIQYSLKQRVVLLFSVFSIVFLIIPITETMKLNQWQKNSLTWIQTPGCLILFIYLALLRFLLVSSLHNRSARPHIPVYCLFPAYSLHRTDTSLLTASART